jgi:hypothetical protein
MTTESIVYDLDDSLDDDPIDETERPSVLLMQDCKRAGV